MGLRGWKVGLAACVALALAAPVLASIGYARHQARTDVLGDARLFAGEVLHRSEVTADQVQSAADRLTALPGEPCAPDHLALMRSIDVDSSYIQAVGHVEGNSLVCSSLSLAGAIDLGPPLLRGPSGAYLRPDVRLSPDDATSFVVIEQDGYAAIIHKQLPLDVSNDSSALSVATLSTPSGQVLTSRGVLDPSWSKRAVHGRTVQFVDHSHAVVVAGSKRWNIAAVAALAPQSLHTQMTRALQGLLPAGIVIGLVLAVLVLLLGRRRLALPAELRAALRREAAPRVPADRGARLAPGRRCGGAAPLGAP